MNANRLNQALETAQREGVDGMSDPMLRDLVECIYVQRAALAMSKTVIKRLDSKAYPAKVIALNLIGITLPEVKNAQIKGDNGGGTLNFDCPECGSVPCTAECHAGE